MLEIGTKAPAFSLPDQNGDMHTLEEYRGKKVILYFYPKDNTPAAPNSLRLRGPLSQFAEKGAVVLGVSKDSVASHKKFEESTAFPSPCSPIRSSPASRPTMCGRRKHVREKDYGRGAHHLPDR